MVKSSKHNVLASLFNLACQKYFIQDGIHLSNPPINIPSFVHHLCNLFKQPTYLVEIKDQIQFANVTKECIQNLDEKVDCFEIGQFVVIGIHAYAKEQASITTIHDLVVTILSTIPS